MKTIADDVCQPLPVGVPPWMWYWCVMFTLNLPVTFAAWFDSYESLQRYIKGIEQVRAINPDSVAFEFLNYPTFFIGNLFGLFLIFGLFTILLPHLRSFYIERYYDLVSPPETKQSIVEIRDFVRTHAPGLEIKSNFTRPGFVFVYPSGYSKAMIAVFSGFRRLWRKDREAAEAVLLHEIAHYRRGDALFLGPGSILEATIKYFTLFILILYILSAVVQAARLVETFQEMNSFRQQINEIGKQVGTEESPSPNYLLEVSIYVITIFWGLFTTIIAWLIRTVASLVMPIACIWAAEFNADFSVSNYPKHKAALLRELMRPKTKVSLYRRFFFKLAHPPGNLRRFFLKHSDSYIFSLLLLIFPLAVLIRIVVLHVWVFFVYNGIGGASVLAGQTTEFTWQSYLSSLIENTRIALTSNPWDWLLMSGLLLGWTFAVRHWERFFTGGRRGFLPIASEESIAPNIDVKGSSQSKSRFKYYALAASLTGLVFIIALVWRD
jgi:Zn-dependent protease with chaperone function